MIALILGRVVGTVVSTRKHDALVGSKFLIVETTDVENKTQLVAVDTVGAGFGEQVLVALGSSARKALFNEEAPVDAAIVGIVDNEC